MEELEVYYVLIWEQASPRVFECKSKHAQMEVLERFGESYAKARYTAIYRSRDGDFSQSDPIISDFQFIAGE